MPRNFAVISVKKFQENRLGALLSFSRSVDAINKHFATVANWFVLFATLVCALDALLRYGINALLFLGNAMGETGGAFSTLFDLYRENSNTLRDLQLVMFAGMVMLGAAYTLKINEHVRVDVLYGAASHRTRAWIDLIGTVLFLIPFCLMMIWMSLPWFLESWNSNELSQNAGGMPRWPAKFFIPFGFFMLLLQGLSELIKCRADLAGIQSRQHAYEKPLQ